MTAVWDRSGHWRFPVQLAADVSEPVSAIDPRTMASAMLDIALATSGCDTVTVLNKQRLTEGKKPLRIASKRSPVSIDKAI